MKVVFELVWYGLGIDLSVRFFSQRNAIFSRGNVYRTERIAKGLFGKLHR